MTLKQTELLHRLSDAGWELAGTEQLDQWLEGTQDISPDSRLRQPLDHARFQMMTPGKPATGSTEIASELAFIPPWRGPPKSGR